MNAGILNANSLNERQKRFCEAYVRHPVGRHAALEAGYSPKGATVQACRLLERPEVRARIDALQADVAVRNCQRTDAILSKLEAIYDGALSSHQFHAAVRAVELQVRLSLMASAGDADNFGNDSLGDTNNATLMIDSDADSNDPDKPTAPTLVRMRPVGRPVGVAIENVNRGIPMLTGKGGEG